MSSGDVGGREIVEGEDSRSGKGKEEELTMADDHRMKK